MPSAPFYPFRAFISYGHRYKTWCDWLHRNLERYRISSDLAGRITEAGPVPRHLRPVFRDRADFSAGPLQAQTIEALKNSQYLIVIASPDSAASAYVNEAPKPSLGTVAATAPAPAASNAIGSAKQVR